MTDELISKTDVVKIVKSVLSPASSLTNVARARRQILNEINELESKPEPHWIPVTEEPKKIRGQWIDRGERGDWEWQADGRGKHWHEWECNICHHYFAERSFFCPHCGSNMRGMTT